MHVLLERNCGLWTMFLGLWIFVSVKSSLSRTKSSDGSLSVSPVYSAPFITHSSTHITRTKTHRDMHDCCSADVNLSAVSFKRTGPEGMLTDVCTHLFHHYLSRLFRLFLLFFSFTHSKNSNHIFDLVNTGKDRVVLKFYFFPTFFIALLCAKLTTVFFLIEVPQNITKTTRTKQQHNC